MFKNRNTKLLLCFVLSLFLICATRISYLPLKPFKITQAQSSTINIHEYNIINLNTATIEQLCLLPEIDEETAKYIYIYRLYKGGFKSSKEIYNIIGITEELISLWEGHFTI